MNILGTQFHPEFDKMAGDEVFLDERELLEEHNYNVEEIISNHPTVDAGYVFFGYFLSWNK